MDWRATTSRRAQDDLDTLFVDSLQAAATSLAENDTFAPFMLVIGEAGDKGMRVPRDPPTGRSEDELVRLLQVTNDQLALRARATVLDVVASAPFSGDAIKVKLEHREGIAIDMLVPYMADHGSVTIDAESADAASGRRLLWGGAAPSA